MGVLEKKDNTKENLEGTLPAIEAIQKHLSTIGAHSGQIEFTSENGKMIPILKSVTLEKVDANQEARLAIKNIALADPGNIQEVAATQFELSDSYYKSVLQQAKQSFVSALIAAGIGLIFFLTAVGIIFFRQPESISTISLISGTLIEVISGINFYLYGRASSQLVTFHNPLVRTQHFLLANSV